MNRDPNPNPNPNRDNPNNLLDTIILLGYNVRIGCTLSIFQDLIYLFQTKTATPKQLSTFGYNKDENRQNVLGFFFCFFFFFCCCIPK